MHTLFPAIRPNNRFFLEAGGGHRLFVEESGSPEGIPVIFVHGGPGAGCENYHRCFFDPDEYRIILFDQRGCGRSTPHASLENNTTADLVSDMEAIRKHLEIDRWLVFGGSWGSTLGLVYAETYPQRVLGLVLRGIFLCRPQEIHWFYQEGANRIFPDYWQDFIAPVPESERDNMLQAHYRRLTGDDELARMASAKAWSIWEGRASNLHQVRSVVDFFGSPHTAISLARIEAHYFMNDAFLEPNQILRDINKIESIPGVIIQGRYDMVCPMESAWALHQAWPQSRMYVVPDAGHSAKEPGIVDALIHTTNTFAKELAPQR